MPINLHVAKEKNWKINEFSPKRNQKGKHKNKGKYFRKSEKPNTLNRTNIIVIFINLYNPKLYLLQN